MSDIINSEQVESKIIEIRGQKSIIDSDIAELYNVETNQLMKQLKITQINFQQDISSRSIKKSGIY